MSQDIYRYSKATKLNVALKHFCFIYFILICLSLRANDSMSKAIDRKQVFKNIPMNSDLRCLGISLVVETLLEQNKFKPDSKLKAETFAKTIYQSLYKKNTISVPAKIEIDNKTYDVWSKEAINHLGTLVSDIYKAEYKRNEKTPEGKIRLKTSSKYILKRHKDIIDVLNKDSDKHQLFLGSGMRFFNDGSIKTTHHAFILFLKDKELYVYDPNDPRQAWKCKIRESIRGVIVSWRCKYRDTGEVTNQSYYLTTKQDNFTKVLLNH